METTVRPQDIVWDENNPPEVGTPEHALWLAHFHFAWESPDQLDRLPELYHPDIIWEVPSRFIRYEGVDDVLTNYRRVFESAADLQMNVIDRYATAERVFDDSEVKFKLIDSKGFPNHPFPVGTRVHMRMLHSFHIKDGLIIRENGYEIWRPLIED